MLKISDGSPIFFRHVSRRVGVENIRYGFCYSSLVRSILSKSRYRTDRVLGGQARSVLVSFCNVRAPHKSPLALASCRNGKWRVIDLDLPLPWPTGSTGMCYWNSKLAICLQGGEREGTVLANRIALLEPDKSFAVHSYCELPDYCDPHSLAADEDSLYVAATGKDSIYRATFDGEQWDLNHYWTLPGSDGKRDRNHINGLTLHEGRLLTSGFERKGSGGWESANRGFVYDVTAESYLMRGINHPHSVIATDEELISCESKESRLVFDSGKIASFDLGYLRGLFTDKHYYYVGISKRRRFSKSSDGEKARRIYEGECAVFRMHKKSGEIEQVADFSECRNEIYDLLPL